MKRRPFGLTFLYLLCGQTPRSSFCFLLEMELSSSACHGLSHHPHAMDYRRTLDPSPQRGRLFAFFVTKEFKHHFFSNMASFFLLSKGPPPGG